MSDHEPEENGMNEDVPDDFADIEGMDQLAEEFLAAESQQHEAPEPASQSAAQEAIDGGRHTKLGGFDDEDDAGAQDMNDDDDDDDGVVRTRKRVRETEQEDEEEEPDDSQFVFNLDLPDIADEADEEEVRSRFLEVFFATPLKPSAEYELKQMLTRAAKPAARSVVKQKDKERAEAERREAADEFEDLMQTKPREPSSAREESEEHIPEFEDDANERDLEGHEFIEDTRNAEMAANEREAAAFFGIVDEEDEEMLLDEDEREAFKHIEVEAKAEDEKTLEKVIPPDDLKRLYLRREDELIQQKDLPERYQLALRSVGWTYQDVAERIFSDDSESCLPLMSAFIKREAFREGGHNEEQIAEVLVLMLREANEPVVVQRYCLLTEKSDESWTLDSLWMVWNLAFQFMSIWNHREQLKNTLFPLYEAFVDGFFPDIAASTRFPYAGITAREKLWLRKHENLDSLSYEMFLVSHDDLSSRAAERWSWMPHYLTWMEKWITFWDDVLSEACRVQRTATPYRHDAQRIRTMKHDVAVRLRGLHLYEFAARVSAHPSTIAYFMTSTSDEELVNALTGRTKIESLKDSDKDRLRGIQHQTCSQPADPPELLFFRGTIMMHQSNPGVWGDISSNESAIAASRKMRAGTVTMLAGGLAVEPRFKQVVLDLIKGYEDQSIMALGRLRTQPSPKGFSYFKQGGTTRNGYRNIPLNSPKLTEELKEELVRYVENGLMVWWIELDDPSTVKEILELEQTRKEAESQSQSQASSRLALSTATTALTHELEVSRLNTKREALADQGIKFQGRDHNMWFPMEMSFEAFRESIKTRKVEIITKVLRDAHRDGEHVNYDKLPFLPLDDWYTHGPPPLLNPGQQLPEDLRTKRQTQDSWRQFRVEVVTKAVSLCLDEVENTIWDNITVEVQDKVLQDCCRSIRRLSSRAGFQWYKVKAPELDAEDEAAKRMMIDDEIFNKSDKDYMLDPRDDTPPGQFRVAGVVFDEVQHYHTVCFLDEHGNYLASFQLMHYSMQENDPLTKEKRDEMQIQLRKCLFTHRPQAWAIGMTDASDLRVREMLQKFSVDWRALLDDKEARHMLPPGFKIPKIEMVDAKVARVWARSRAAHMEFRDLDEAQRRAVAVGRTLRSPLAAVSSLFTADNDALNLGLSEMQDMVPKLKLLRHLEQQMVSLVSIIGLDINLILNETTRSYHSILQFLPGLGPRKAAYILRGIYGRSCCIVNRSDLRLNPFNLKDIVFRNAAGFVKVLPPVKYGTEPPPVDPSSNILDTTRVHPMLYQLAYVMVFNMATSLGKVTPQQLEDLNDEEYEHEMKEQVRALVEDYHAKKREGKVSTADLLQIEWEGFKDEWDRLYHENPFGQICGEEVGMLCHKVKLPDMMQMIFDEMMEPFGLRSDEAAEELHAMQEYRPYTEDSVFDTLVDDPTLTRGELRTVVVTDTTLSGLRVRVSGANAARGFVLRSETVPGSQYTETDWQVYRAHWFKKGMQFEAVVTTIRKHAFSIDLTIIPEKVKEAKMKVDKHFLEMERLFKKKERERKGAAATLTADTLSQAATQTMTGTLTDSQTAASTLDSDIDGDSDDGRVRFEVDAGPLLSHPLYKPSVRSAAQAELMLVTKQPDGKDYFPPGTSIIRPNFRTRNRSRFWVVMRMPSVPIKNKNDILGIGAPNEVVDWAAFVHVAFEMRGIHGGKQGVYVVDRHLPEGGRLYSDVDHMLHSHIRELYKQILAVQTHPKWDNRPWEDVRRAVALENKKRYQARNKDIAWSFCAAPAVIERKQDGSKVSAKPMHFLVILPARTREEQRLGKTVVFEFEARVNYYLMRKAPDGIKGVHSNLSSLSTVIDAFQHCYKALLSSSGKLMVSRTHAVEPAIVRPSRTMLEGYSAKTGSHATPTTPSMGASGKHSGPSGSKTTASPAVRHISGQVVSSGLEHTSGTKPTSTASMPTTPLDVSHTPEYHPTVPVQPFQPVPAEPQEKPNDEDFSPKLEPY